MKFVQVIEFHSSRIDEMNALMDEWEAAVDGQDNLPTHVLQCGDRDKPGTYLQIVEFASYEAAMANSAKSETGDFAERMGKLCEGPPTFRNLDVLRDETVG